MSVSTRQDVNRALRQWLRSHHGVIGRSEALRLGASAHMIRTKLANGEWEVVYRAVYRDAAVPRSTYQDLRAACVASGGMVSHASAGWVWDLLATAPPQPEVSVVTTGGRRLKGITIHRLADLDSAKAVIREEIRVTNPLRTIVDMSASLKPTLLAAAVDTALAKQLVTVEGLTEELGRLACCGRAGVGILRRNLVDRGFIGAPPASVLEAKARRLVLTARLPLPGVEVEVGEYRLDIAWPAILLCVEVDGYVWHFSPEHLQRDAARRNRLQQAGWTVLVYTWRNICSEPARVAREITASYQELTKKPGR